MKRLLLTAILSVLPLIANAAAVFFEDFEDDVTGNNPVINTSAGNIGSSWDNEVSPGVTVVTNPNLMTATETQTIALGAAFPIPAAVWLFASGLGLLLFRRRPTVTAS